MLSVWLSILSPSDYPRLITWLLSRPSKPCYIGTGSITWPNSWAYSSTCFRVWISMFWGSFSFFFSSWGFNTVQDPRRVDIHWHHKLETASDIALHWACLGVGASEFNQCLHRYNWSNSHFMTLWVAISCQPFFLQFRHSILTTALKILPHA